MDTLKTLELSYPERAHYLVRKRDSGTITKFWFIEEAVKFCNRYFIPVEDIVMVVDGSQIDIEAI
jgi:hypothetical protein